MTILEFVLAKMLTSKIVHKYLSNVLVKFENLLTPNFGLIFFTLHVQILLIILPTSFLSVISPFDLLFRWLVVDEHGNFASECLHWEGFPSILWDVMRDAGYPSPQSWCCALPYAHDPRAAPVFRPLEITGDRGDWAPPCGFGGACRNASAHEVLLRQ